MKTYIGPKTKDYKKKVERILKKKKSLSTLLNDLQEVFNKYIRQRDSKNGFFVCISCNTPKPITQMNAGHYFSVGGHPSVRFHEFNTWGQCIYCNLHQHGNLEKYKRNLIKKIGQRNFELLEIAAHQSSKLMPFEVEILIETYKSKLL